MDSRVTCWNSNIETGIAEIDDQHRQLFELAASFRGQGDEIRIMKSLAILCDYAKVHLREEEALLETIGYADLTAHRQAHAEFRALLRQLLNDATHLSLDEIANRVEALIHGWFYNHILRVDAQYVPAVAAYRNYQQTLHNSRRSRRPYPGRVEPSVNASPLPSESGLPAGSPQAPTDSPDNLPENLPDGDNTLNKAIGMAFESNKHLPLQVTEHFGVHYSTVNRVIKKDQQT